MRNKTISFLMLLLALVAIASFSSAPVAFAADQVVNNCSNDTELRNDLQGMQDSTGGTLVFNCGAATIVLTGGVLPTIIKNTTIDGGGKITLSGGLNSQLFITFAALTLNNITITKGYVAVDDGGAINAGDTLNINNSKFLDNWSDGGSGGAIVAYGALNITNSEFANNKAANGGALYLKWGNADATISASNFHNNQTTSTTDGWGGAILLFDGASATIGSTTFNLNQARYGGAVYVLYPSSLTLNNNSVLSNNKAVESGGGIYNSGTATLTNVTLNANEAGSVGGGISSNGAVTLNKVTLSSNKVTGINGWGGGIYIFKRNVTVTNSTFSGNSATARGGGMMNDDGDAWLSNVTFSGNSAPNGGGIYSYVASEHIKNTLFAKGANGANCYSIDPGSFNLSDDNSCGFEAGRNNVTNLNLDALKNNGGSTKTHLPLAGSAAIDNANCTDVFGAPVAGDQRDIARPQGTACDVGAVEVCGKPNKPALEQPKNGGKVKKVNVPLNWGDTLCATKYNVIVKQGATNGAKAFGKKNITASQITTSALQKGQTFFWQVTAIGEGGKTKSDWWSFQVR